MSELKKVLMRGVSVAMFILLLPAIVVLFGLRHLWEKVLAERIDTLFMVGLWGAIATWIIYNF